MNADPYVTLAEAKQRDRAAEKLRRGLHVIYPSALEGKPVPERGWIVPGLLPVGSVTMLSGDGGLGKSTLLLQLLAAAALGSEFIGFQVPQIRACGFFAEDDEDELHRRMAAILPALGSSFADLEDRLSWVSRVGLDNAMMTWNRQTGAGEITPFAAQVQNHALDTGSQLVVLDSLHDVYVGNENDRSQVRQFVGSLREIAMECAAAVILAAHPSMAGLANGSGTSGSTAWNNAVRSRLYLKRPPDDAEGGEVDRSVRILSHPKSNYSADGGEWRLRLVDGAFVRDDATGGMVGALERLNAEEAFLIGMDMLAKQGRPVTDGMTTSRYAPKALAGLSIGGRKYTKTELRRAMDALFARGEIAVGSVKGPDRKPMKCIVRSARGAQ